MHDSPACMHVIKVCSQKSCHLFGSFLLTCSHGNDQLCSVPDADMLLMSAPRASPHVKFKVGSHSCSHLQSYWKPCNLQHTYICTYCGYKCVYLVRHHCRTQSYAPYCGYKCVYLVRHHCRTPTYAHTVGTNVCT